MPIYEYACSACGHQFEEWQKITDKAIRTCPKCKAKKVEKLISQTSFHLKGGGWYSDLYAGPKPGGQDRKDGKDGGKDKDGGANKESGKESSNESTSKESKETKAASTTSPSGTTTSTKTKTKKSGSGSA